ncbi:MAG: imidazole glycerol phosphate synthase subunit HisF [Thermoplasmatales archaeon]|nr:MAG: imidazole glycerol phosphate synthase subunit HisF [Thermoplasmatales archaeon]
MLVKRIIPCLDVDNGVVMKGKKFQGLNKIGDPIELAEHYNIQGADELVFLDIGASPFGRKTLFEIVNKVSKKVFIPLTVGGGIRTLENIQYALSNGADRISINTAAVIDPDLIKKSSDRFGSQCIVCAIDAQKDGNSWSVLINGGRKKTDIDAILWAEKVEKYGAGEILLTSWDADGTKKGYNLELTQAIAEAVNISVIASGGAGSLKDILDVLTIGKADAALIASLFHYKIYTIEDVKIYLKNYGVEVR